MSDNASEATTSARRTPAATGGAAWTDRYARAVMDTFGPPQRVLVRGDGAYVWDADENRYLDLLGGIAVNALGHAHPTLTAAISAQLGTLGHISNFFGSPTQIALAERLLALAGAPEGSRVYFANSGAEANEAAIKMARRHRPQGRILALEGSFHGRTVGALSITSKAAYREPFGPLLPGIEFVAAKASALTAAFSSEAVAERGEVAAVIAEPIQGEAGVHPLPPGLLAAIRTLTDRHGALMILDEIQTGMGRTGSWLAHHELAPGVIPDAVTVAKGLGGGFPIGAVVAYGQRSATLLGRGQHGTTFGGNPVAAAAALATIGVIERDGLLANTRDRGAQLRTEIARSNPLIDGVRGAGLLLGVQLTRPCAAEVAARALAEGFIVNAVMPDTIRLAPPLILTADQAHQAAQFFAGLALTENAETKDGT